MTTILYVEDHPPAAMLMTAIIEDMTDYDIIHAEDGAAAIAALASVQPDLYILDMDLPDTTGLKLADELLTLHSAPVIVVSAYAEAIATDYLYLAKPLDPDYVVETLRRALS